MNNIKKIIPNKIKARIKIGSHKRDYYEELLCIKREENDYDILIGTPIHTNLGDHLITISEKRIIGDLCPRRKIYEIPSEAFIVYKKKLKEIVRPTARIFINGGGWMGNLWPHEEILLQNIVDSFYKNKIIIFPQTIYFDEKLNNTKRLIERANRIYDKCNDVTLFVRDQSSYSFAKDNYHIKKIYLVPDVALYYQWQNKNKRIPRLIGVCIREDREKEKNDKFLISISEKLESNGYTIKKISTMHSSRVFENDRNEMCENILGDFEKCELIITDRLHGMIFSYITNTPCVVLDNKTKKVSGVYEKWLFNCKFIYPAFSNHDVEDCMNYIMRNNKTINKESFKESFSSLNEEIEYGGN